MNHRIKWTVGLALALGGAATWRLVAQHSESGEWAPPASELAPMLERYADDRSSLDRYFGAIGDSATGRRRLRRFTEDWKKTLAGFRFEELNHPARADYLLLDNLLRYRLRRLDIVERQLEETASLVPFRETVLDLEANRLQMQPLDARETAATLTRLAADLKKRREQLEKAVARPKPAEDAADGEADSGFELPPGTASNRAATEAADLAKVLEGWFEYYDGYDPLFSWWVRQPYGELRKALDEYARFLREKVVGIKPDDEETIIGDPIGRDALLADLAYEMIPYSPEEIVEIAGREFEWCEREMLRASRDLGYGDDWKAALEHVKQQHVEPGAQPALIRELALEAIEFVESRDLVTVPPLARSTWRMQMLSPQQQLVSPFFLGGEIIRVSYPTDEMTHEQKLMSMRGNNRHFSRATVHHELIPGHHLQGFMTSRYNTHRRLFSTPFWGEGWALYWEMLLWDLDFPQSAEDRIGMLFWRMHRCARILFSLGFHLGTMTPEECIELLVDKVGHERANAAAEVRRSFAGSYSPLYQAAYMLGGLQFRSLHRELVQSGRMNDREFHDRILRENRIPVEMVRVLLTGAELSADWEPGWRFYE